MNGGAPTFLKGFGKHGKFEQFPGGKRKFELNYALIGHEPDFNIICNTMDNNDPNRFKSRPAHML